MLQPELYRPSFNGYTPLTSPGPDLLLPNLSEESQKQISKSLSLLERPTPVPSPLPLQILPVSTSLPF